MTPDNFIAKIKPYAMAEQMRSGVLSSITIAQGALESGWGEHAPNNNLFGIKATRDEAAAMQSTREFIPGKNQWITINARFRSYSDWGKSIADHSQFLLDNPRYRRSNFFQCADRLDYIGCATALQAAGYATDPSYAKSLIGLIQKYDLDAIDKEAKNMLDDLIDRIATLEKEVSELNEQNAMPEIPDWAKEAVESAVKAGLVKEANNGSKDFYRLMTILHRKGIL